MTLKTQLLTITLVISLLFAITTLVQDYLATSTPSPTQVTTTCQEDQPCWDCETMGNGVCGPAVPPPSTEAPREI